MKKRTIGSWRAQIFILCWAAYAGIYFGRGNLSVGMTQIQNSVGLTKAQIGLVASLFFWIYGFGQLVNGYLGDKGSGRLFIFFGLFVTGVANLLFGFTASLAVMCVLWGLNGYAQSMLWGPMEKTLSSWFEPRHYSEVTISISTSMVFGSLAALLLFGSMLMTVSWNWIFWIPGAALIAFSAVWYFSVRDRPGLVRTEWEGGGDGAPGGSAGSVPSTLWQVIRETKLWYVVIACFAQGIVKDGINLWAPTFFMETYGLNIKSAAAYVVLIPVLNFGGMFLAGWLNKKLAYRDKVTTCVLFGIGMAMIVGLILFGKYNVIIGLVFLSLSSAMMYGANTVLLGVLPMRFLKYNKVSAVAGFLDCNSYIASGAATVVTGLLVNRFGWGVMMYLWLFSVAAGTVSLLISQKSEKSGLLAGKA